MWGADPFKATTPTDAQTTAADDHAAWLAGLPSNVGRFKISNGLALDDWGNDIPLDGFTGLSVSDLARALDR